MTRHIPANEILCPNCRGNVIFVNNSYTCKECQETFPIQEGIHILLHKRMEPCKKNEDKIWRLRKDSLCLKEPAWKALIYKADMIKSFEKNILSLYTFKGKVLELGAGCCWASTLVKAKFPNTVMYTTDISPFALQKGKDICKVTETEINYFATCDAENIPFKDGLFDAAFSVALLHHLPSPIKALREIKRVLRPNGFYIGFGEIMSSRIARPFYRKFSDAEKRSKDLGILENTYTYIFWKTLVRESGFAFFNINLHTDPKYRRNFLASLYYEVIKNIPSIFIKNLLFSSCWIFARKN